MLKLSVVAMSFFGCITSVQAEEFMFMRCSAIVDQPARASVIVGWANLQNREGTTQNFDFDLYAQQADALVGVCKKTPGLPLYRALISAFSEVDDELPWAKDEMSAYR